MTEASLWEDGRQIATNGVLQRLQGIATRNKKQQRLMGPLAGAETPESQRLL